MNLDHSLVLHRFMNALFGAEHIDDLQRVLKDLDEGPGDDGHSWFFHALVGRTGLRIGRSNLQQHDLRIVDYEARLAKTRRAEPFRAFKYFQYLALLYTDIYLDRLTSDTEGLRRDLNRFRTSKVDFADIPAFKPDDLRRLAFFMATGSGKTLLLHVNILQVLHYLEHGAHPEALVRRTDGRREFDNVLLITPGEGLSDQHILELKDSGLDADRFDRLSPVGLFGPRVQVIEIHKIAEEPVGGGVSVPIVELGGRNLVLVDEGHKGTGSEARAWKNRQESLSADGFLLEYSATFAQAIGAASPVVRQEILGTYGKSILFDYSYRYFYGDGYGKTFRVLNLKRASASKAHDLILGGMLVFYQQSMLFARHHAEIRTYELEKPLWVLLGTSVSKKRADEKDTSAGAEQERADVAEVVAFLRRFLEEPEWATDRIGKTIAGKSGFVAADSGADLFESHLRHLLGENPKALYERICRDLFHGRGGLEVVEMKRSGEVGLRVTAGSRKNVPYFGIINIGDVSDFRKHLEQTVKIEAREDVITDSLFDSIARADSPINVLIGAKKFIEGWSSWRVSSMGLLRVGRGEGSQVIQLFGRGVRLKGRAKSLKRSYALGGAPPWLESLETLFIVGWNADYLQIFREMLDKEDLSKELAPLRVVQKPMPEWVLVPRMPPGFDASMETWTLADDGPPVRIDLLPQAVSVEPGHEGTVQKVGLAGESEIVTFGNTRYASLVDIDRLRAELCAYKATRGYANVYIDRQAVQKVLASHCEVRMFAEDARDPLRVHQGATRALMTYLDRFVRLRQREAESERAEPGPLIRERQVVREYRITVRGSGPGERFLGQIEALLKTPKDWLKDAGEPLPRLNVDWHLFNPLIREGGKEWREYVSVSPSPLVASEARLVQDLIGFWRKHRETSAYRNVEVRLLRNLPKVGVGVFARSGFYPDFILWVRDKKTQTTRIVFLDPHGLHHEGVVENDRFKAVEKLRTLGERRPFSSKRITLDGYVIAPTGTKLEHIKDRGGMTWADLEATYPLLRQDEPLYIERALSGSR